MKKKWSLIIAAVLAVLTLVAGVAPALAQDDGTTNVRPVIDGLAVIVPLAAPTGEPVTMTVLQRSDATPVEGAAVWALTPEQADAFDRQVSALREAGELTDAETDWDAVVGVYAIFLGRTDAHGKVTYAFQESGRYRIVTTKWGYVPGHSSILIGKRPESLAIRAPERAKVGEPVVMTVYAQPTQGPVAGAGVWALTREQAEAFKQQIDALQAQDNGALADADWESLVSIYGRFLGWTGDNGQLEYTFNESGGYLLLAVKRGYLPGRHRIFIGETPKFLALRIQNWAKVGEVVPMMVFNRDSGEPVPGAGVWALTREQADALRQEMAAMAETDRAALASTDWESVVSVRGSFLGRTDERGYLETVFGVAGPYVLVTVKPGYVPGFAFITIREPRPSLDADNAQLRPDAGQVEPEPFDGGQGDGPLESDEIS